jgi:hypothetical protein
MEKKGIFLCPTLSISGRRIDFLVEKTDRDARITLQVQENGERVLKISVYRTTVEESENDKYYKFTIDVASGLKNFRVELVAEILDLIKVDFNWLNMSDDTFAKLIEERGLEFVVKQLTRDLFSFIMESVGIQQ